MAESFLIRGIETLKEIGFFDFFLPFLLFFSIIYGGLEKTEIFGKGRRDINSIVAFSIALLASTTGVVIKAFGKFVPWVGFIALVVVSFVMILAYIHGDFSSLLKNPFFIALGFTFSILGLFLALFFALGWNVKLREMGFTDLDMFLTIIFFIIVVFVFVPKLASKMKSSKEGGSENN